MVYSKEEHAHRFAAWAASRASSVKGQRFKVEIGVILLETIGLKPGFQLPAGAASEQTFDQWHNEKCQLIITQAQGHNLRLSYGVAAKLLNMYMKARLVIPYPEHPGAYFIHPPIDRLLLNALIDEDGERQKQWRQYRNKGWSNWGKEDYLEVIGMIKKTQNGEPLWMIERFWRGYQ